jgi:phosphatidylserine/phosphatidylglycerophosphate/cardiolipin synthase-like enzyme
MTRKPTQSLRNCAICIVDDVWTCVGSDNLNMRSWTHDSELACAVMDANGGRAFARALRMQLHREHLDLRDDDCDLTDPEAVFTAYRDSAKALDAWQCRGDGSPRPAGRLRTYRQSELGRGRRLALRPLYRMVCDPDGRPIHLRIKKAF